MHHPNIQQAGAYNDTQIKENKHPAIINIPNSVIKKAEIINEIVQIKTKHIPHISYIIIKKHINKPMLAQRNRIPKLKKVGISI